MIAGLIIAKQLGHVNYDVKAVFDWLVAELRERKAFVADVGSSVQETLSNYIAEH